jgi:hypothetical protein
MPILHSDISANAYQRVAIVEAWGNPGQENEVLDAVRRGACQTGADALLILSSQSQMDGRYGKMDLPKDSNEHQGEEDSAARVRSFKEGLAPKVGEAGHAGYYVDGVALVYKQEKGRANVSP